MVDGETGLLVEAGDPSALRAALTASLTDDSRRLELGAAARGRTLERFTWDRVAEALSAVYDSLPARPS